MSSTDPTRASWPRLPATTTVSTWPSVSTTSVQPPALPSTGLPLAARDVPFSGNTCGNNGGLDQDIVGALVGLS